MIHPDTVLQFINDEIGYGVYARKRIPKGTIIYVQDQLEISVPENSPLLKDNFYSEILEKYSYIDASGEYILSWDFGRFVNHSCNPNTLSTGYGFEIAIRDILPGEQITDDYGLFNMKERMACRCGEVECREWVDGEDTVSLRDYWDGLSMEAIRYINSVKQPLMHLLDRHTYQQLVSYINTSEGYLSVSQLARKGQRKNKLSL